MEKYSMSPPYIVTVYENPNKFKTYTIGSNKLLNKFREKLDKNKLWYSISCTKKEEIETHYNPPRISGPSKEPDKKREKNTSGITVCANNISSAYTEAMEKLFKAWK